MGTLGMARPPQRCQSKQVATAKVMPASKRHPWCCEVIRLTCCMIWKDKKNVQSRITEKRDCSTVTDLFHSIDVKSCESQVYVVCYHNPLHLLRN